MKNKLLNNLGIKILSALAAVIIWVLVVNVDDYKVTKTITDIPITVVNEDAITQQDRVFELDGDGTVDIIVKGRRSLVEGLESGDFIATADMSQLSLTNAVQVQVKQVNASGKRQLSITCPNDMVNVSLEKSLEKQINITVRTEGEPAKGYAIGSKTTTPNMITVSGAQSVIKRIQSVQVTVDVTGASSDISTVADLIFLNSDGERVSTQKLDTNIETVNTTVEILQTKEIPVTVQTSGIVADGYGIAGVDYQPTSITVAGKKDALDKLDGLDIHNISVSGLTENKEFTIEVANYLPTGVQTTEDMDQIMIQVVVEPIVERDIVLAPSDITMVGQSDMYTYSFADASATLAGKVIAAHVTGVQSVVEAMTAADLACSMDVSNLSTGEHNVKLTYTTPERCTIKMAKKLRVSIQTKSTVTQ